MFTKTKKFFAGIAALSLTWGITLPAFADDSGRYLDVTLIGDSYTAGNGAGSYYGPENAYRSSRNWGHVYVDWLNQQGVQTSIRNLAVSGGVTKDVLEKQIPQLSPKSDLVMLTIGGNDIKFEEIVKNCFVLGIRSYAGCENAMNYAEKTFPQTRANIIRVFEEVQKKVADDAKIILVGYPLLSIESDYSIGNGWLWSDKYYPAAAKVREFGQFATREQAQMVKEWNENPENKVKVTFVPTEVHFATHEPDPDTSKQNPYRWLNEMLEDEGEAGPDGVIKSKGTGVTEIYSWYHPNITGHREIAALLQKNVGVPDNVRSVRSNARDVDVMFVVENSQATAGNLDEYKAHIRRIMKEMNAAASAAGFTARFGLVTHHDPADAPQSGAETPIQPVTAPPADGFRMAAQPTAADNAAPAAEENDNALNTPPADAVSAETDSNNSGTVPANGAAETSTNAETASAESASAGSGPSESDATTPAAPAEPVKLVTPLGGEGLEEAIDALSDNGTDGSATFFTAVDKALDQFNNPGARQLVVALGDLKADPGVGDWGALTNKAFATGAEIMAIDVNAEPSAEVATLVRRTGGYTTSVETVRPLIVPEPVASFTAPELGAVGVEQAFDATASFPAPADVAKYEWDFDSDGTVDFTSAATETQPALPTAAHTWSGPFNGNVTLRVHDKFGRQAEISASVNITLDGDLVEEGDNCPLVANPDQKDWDQDGIGDVCDPTPRGETRVPHTAPTVEELPKFDINSLIEKERQPENKTTPKVETVAPSAAAQNTALARTGADVTIWTGAALSIFAAGVFARHMKRK